MKFKPKEYDKLELILIKALNVKQHVLKEKFK